MRRKGYAEEYLLWLLLFDLLAVAGGLALTYFFRFRLAWIPSPKGWEAKDYLIIWPVACAAWLIGLTQAHAYRRGSPVLDLDGARRLFVGSLIAMALVITYNFFARDGEYSRYMPVIAVAFAWPSLIVERWIFSRILLRVAAQRMDRVLIVGAGHAARRIARVIQRQPHYGMALAGFIADSPERVGQPVPEREGVAFLGHVGAIGAAAREAKAQQVIIAHPDLPPEVVEQVLNDCEHDGILCRLVPNLMYTSFSEGAFQDIGGIPVYDARYTPLQGWNVVLKRVFDVAVSAICLLSLSPVMILAAILIKLDSKGPLLYKQQRVGLDGRKFNLYKFRSMVEQAEKDCGPVFAKDGDPRVTRVGKFFRRFNIDELPQLINVLRGDMSLVGPRPERPHFVKKFRDEIPNYMLRHRAKAGITGWAQVNGLRGDTSIEARIAYDLYYIENWTLWLDIKILLMTFVAWKNAY
ncbi:MAG: undecaprenyl-phosphate glucose phosphotransferase [Candidatus Sumerlaeota bacterium]|nr:undecaprenyl-phosphate glucose phosphotransferase [Candidatus Sumerlaeota bacterium]